MNSLAAAVGSYVVNAVWQVPLLAGTGWLICRLLRRLGPAIEHRVWVAILFASVVLPVLRPFHLAGPALTVSAHEGAAVRLHAWEPVAVGHAGLLNLPTAIIMTVAALYLLISVLFLFRYLGAVRSTVVLVNGAYPVSLEAAYAHAWEEARSVADLAYVEILSSPRITGPVTLWVGRSVLLVPEGFAQSSSVADFRVAVAHECAHVQRRDCLKNLFYEAVSLVAAFHPVTWLIKAQIAQTREMTCDALAVETVGGSRVYVEALLRLASAIACCSPAANPYAIGIFDANILEKRIMTLRAKKERVSSASRYGLLFLGGLCLFLAVAGGASTAVGLSAGRSGNVVSDQTGEKIYTIGGDVSAPRVLYAPEPAYPKSERQKDKFEGECLIGLVVDRSGMPKDVHVLRSLSKDFDEKAIEAVQAYRFEPAVREGKPVSVSMQVEINFQKF